MNWGAGQRTVVDVTTATYVVRTPCHNRRVFLDERELQGEQRRVTFPCPRCSRIWVVRMPAPTALWIVA
jgi:hypothetical protein